MVTEAKYTVTGAQSSKGQVFNRWEFISAWEVAFGLTKDMEHTNTRMQSSGWNMGPWPKMKLKSHSNTLGKIPFVFQVFCLVSSILLPFNLWKTWEIEVILSEANKMYLWYHNTPLPVLIEKLFAWQQKTPIAPKQNKKQQEPLWVESVQPHGRICIV